MKKIFLIWSLASLLFSGKLAFAEEYTLQPQPGGAEIQLSATFQLNVPNDLAYIRLSAIAEEKDLAAAQSEVNERMAEAQKAIKDFSSLARIQNGGYYTQAIYSRPKEEEAPEIAAWRARQSVRVETEDVHGVGSLVQVAQQSRLALDHVAYGLSEEAKAAAQDKLTQGVIEELNRKTDSLALALRIAPQAFKFKKLDFMNSDLPQPEFLVRNVALAKADSATVAQPEFEAGHTKLSVSVQATLVIESADNP